MVIPLQKKCSLVEMIVQERAAATMFVVPHLVLRHSGEDEVRQGCSLGS